MYSGTTLTPISGRILGAHQKIDRLAYAGLTKLLGNTHSFPTSHQILHFEGAKGPDAIKRKSPAHDEPWHYIQPFDPDDQQLLMLIACHYKTLVAALSDDDMIRAGFEAAWLAHALVDGLTPAHQFPYEERLSELRGGAGKSSRTTIKTKLVMPGETTGEQLRNNWRMWGPGGLLTTHGLFEFGIAGIIAPLHYKPFVPTPKLLAKAKKSGAAAFFAEQARTVAGLQIYEQYQRRGWTPYVAKLVRTRLLPLIVETVTTVWYVAAVEAQRGRAT